MIMETRSLKFIYNIQNNMVFRSLFEMVMKQISKGETEGEKKPPTATNIEKTFSDYTDLLS